MIQKLIKAFGPLIIIYLLFFWLVSIYSNNHPCIFILSVLVPLLLSFLIGLIFVMTWWIPYTLNDGEDESDCL